MIRNRLRKRSLTFIGNLFIFHVFCIQQHSPMSLMVLANERPDEHLACPSAWRLVAIKVALLQAGSGQTTKHQAEIELPRNGLHPISLASQLIEGSSIDILESLGLQRNYFSDWCLQPEPCLTISLPKTKLPSARPAWCIDSTKEAKHEEGQRQNEEQGPKDHHRCVIR